MQTLQLWKGINPPSPKKSRRQPSVTKACPLTLHRKSVQKMLLALNSAVKPLGKSTMNLPYPFLFQPHHYYKPCTMKADKMKPPCNWSCSVSWQKVGVKNVEGAHSGFSFMFHLETPVHLVSRLMESSIIFPVQHHSTTGKLHPTVYEKKATYSVFLRILLDTA